MKFRAGEAAPWFVAATLNGTPHFKFDTVGGRHILMLIVGSARDEAARAAIASVIAERAMFDDRRAMFFGVTRDLEDGPAGRIEHIIPGIRWFIDHDAAVSRSYRAIGEDGQDQPGWLLLDPMLRVVASASLDQGAQIIGVLRRILNGRQVSIPAPVLTLPRIFEPSFCRHLISIYDKEGGKASGFMREVEGRTKGVMDAGFKRRSDVSIHHDGLRGQIMERLTSNLIPMMARAFNFRATRIERYLIACYDGDEGGGFFKAHRDNTTSGTAHRRFACTINLNAEDYEGGNLVFPEFGPLEYRAPTGGAVVFSCSLMHEARPVTKGKRYVFLPFFYDEAAALQREAIATSGRVGAEHADYRA